MSQDYNDVLAADPISGSRENLINRDEALRTNFSGAAEPTVKGPAQFWYDTTNNLLKIRNDADSAWTTIGSIDAVAFGALLLSGGVMTGNIDCNTNGVFVRVPDPVVAQDVVTLNYFNNNLSKPVLMATLDLSTDATYINPGFYDDGSGNRRLRWAAYRNVGGFVLNEGGSIIEVPEDGDYQAHITISKRNVPFNMFWDCQSPATALGVRKGYFFKDLNEQGTSSFNAGINQLSAGDDFWIIEPGAQTNEVDVADGGSRLRLIVTKV